MKIRNLFFLIFSIDLLAQYPDIGSDRRAVLDTDSGAYSLIKIFDENNGLPSNLVYDITQDENGFLWIATDNGVARFDGTKFYKYSIAEGLPSNDVIQIFKGKNGRIWANSYMKPVSYFLNDFNRFETYSNHQESFRGLRTFKYELGSESYISKGIDDIIEIGNKIVLHPRSEINKIPDSDVFLESYFYKDRKLELNILNKAKKSQVSFRLNYKPVYSFLHHNSLICYGEDEWIHRFQIKKDGTVKADSLRADSDIFILSFNKDNINFVTKNNVINSVSFDDFKIVRHFKLNVLPNTLFVDTKDNVWIGTRENGLYLFKKSAIRNPEIRGVENQNFQFVSFNNQDVFVGNYYGEVIKNNQQWFDVKRKFSRLRNMRVNNVVVSGNNTYVLSEHFIIKNSSKIISSSDFGFSSIKSSVKMDEKHLLLGTNVGLFIMNLQTDKIEKVSKRNFRIINLVKGNDKYYFTTADEIFSYDPKTGLITKLPESSRFKNDFITDIDFSFSNLLWVSTEKGVIHIYRNDQYLKELNFNFLKQKNFKTIKVHNNKIWVGTSGEGVFRCEINFSTPEILQNPVFITSFNGLASDKINSIEVHKNEAYIATKAGVSIVPDSYVPITEDVKPIVIQTTIDGQVVPNSSNIHLNKNQHNVSFFVSYVDYSGSSSKIQYSTNNNGSWTEIDDNVLNVQVTGRSHDIYLRTINKNNNVASAPYHITIGKSLHFYQYNEVWLIFGGLLFSSFVVFQSRKKLRVQKKVFDAEMRHENMLKRERERISQDMHDDLGAGISALKLQAEFLKHKVSDHDVQHDLDELLKTSDDMNTSMREILWSLNSGNDNLGNFIKYITNYGEKFFSRTKIKFTSKILNVKNDTPISTEKRRNLYLALKEVFNNCYKHSNASEITVKFEQKSNLLIVEVEDNGNGFPKEIQEGNGLTNMNYRMREISGQYIVQNLDKGCRITFKVRL